MRMEPPVSVPTEASAIPAATDTADPPLDPPATWLGACGLRVGPNAESAPVVPNANSCRLHLPMKIAPARRRAASTGASAAARCPARAREAASSWAGRAGRAGP